MHGCGFLGVDRLSSTVRAFDTLSPGLSFCVNFAIRLGKLLGFVCFRVFVLPVVIGSVFAVCTSPALGGTVASRIVFARQMPMLFLATHWIMGLTFFLFNMSSMMQVRAGIFARGARVDVSCALVGYESLLCRGCCAAREAHTPCHRRQDRRSIAVRAQLLKIGVSCCRRSVGPLLSIPLP